MKCVEKNPIDAAIQILGNALELFSSVQRHREEVGNWDTAGWSIFAKSNVPVYIKMVELFYAQYIVAQDNISNYHDEKGQYQVLNYTSEEQALYNEHLKNREMYCIASIVFEAFACEAYVNWLGAVNLDKDVFEKIERKSIYCKIKQIPQLAINKSFPVPSDAFNKLELLMKTRNNLAHNQMTEIRLDMEPTKLLNAMWNLGVMGNSIYDTVDKVMGTCQAIQDEMVKLRPGK